MIADLVADVAEHWLLYATIPLIAVLIGWSTKIVAVEMLLRPLEFRGIRPWFGWQGVVPRAAPRMAAVAVELMFTRLIDPQEILRSIDVDELTESLREPLDAAVEHMVDDVLMRNQPHLWVNTPTFARAALVRRVQCQVPGLVAEIVADLRTHLDDIVDLRAMATEVLIRDTALLVRMVREVGREELRFIVRSGLLFGFVLGIVQMLTWALTKSTWMMPVFGGLTGLVTDWLALQMIFRPVRPWRIGRITVWQGMFHRRRAQVSADYITLVTTEILSPGVILDGVFTGPRADRVTALLTHHISAFVDARAGAVKQLATLLAPADYNDLKTDVSEGILTLLRRSSSALDPRALQAIGVQEMLADRLAGLSDDEYEGLLRPAFKQDEWKLVAIGAVLGFLIGELQVLLLLH
ncbi:DUF445 domain-containing protein [Nocardia sp. NPDC050378]|uniref:DUF445 domain-containing protein n=1 Tax=Nocardia sp. NPDC050378 TaxID=3155400 RepID=UPI0033C466FB